MTALLVSFIPGDDYVSAYTRATKADKKATTKTMENNSAHGNNQSPIDDFSNTGIIEFLPGPYHKYSSDATFRKSYMLFAERHGFVPQFDNSNNLVALAKGETTRQVAPNSPTLPAFDEYTDEMRKRKHSDGRSSRSNQVYDHKRSHAAGQEDMDQPIQSPLPT